MPLFPIWSPSLLRTTQKLTDKRGGSWLPSARSKDAESAGNILSLSFESLQKIFLLVAMCLWAVRSLSQRVFKSCLQGLDTHKHTRTCTPTHARAHTYTGTQETHAPNTDMGLYGYTDRFGGLECLKKTSDCFGVSLRGSTSSFLKQAERRLQRGTREKEEVKASDFINSHQLNTETPSYLHDHSETGQNAWEAISTLSSSEEISKISQRGLLKIFRQKWEKAVVLNQHYQNHLCNLKIK